MMKCELYQIFRPAFGPSIFRYYATYVEVLQVRLWNAFKYFQRCLSLFLFPLFIRKATHISWISVPGPSRANRRKWAVPSRMFREFCANSEEISIESNTGHYKGFTNTYYSKRCKPYLPKNHDERFNSSRNRTSAMLRLRPNCILGRTFTLHFPRSLCVTRFNFSSPATRNVIIIITSDNHRLGECVRMFSFHK